MYIIFTSAAYHVGSGWTLSSSGQKVNATQPCARCLPGGYKPNGLGKTQARSPIQEFSGYCLAGSSEAACLPLLAVEASQLAHLGRSLTAPIPAEYPPQAVPLTNGQYKSLPLHMRTTKGFKLTEVGVTDGRWQDTSAN